MAKSKSFFGLRRGSTKAFTFQVLNGGQITKDRVSDVKNPRTRAQMAQRMIMATAGSAYKHMRPIIDHAFEGISYGQKSYSEFMRLNVHDMVEDVRGDLGQFSYNPYGDERIYPSPYIMSRGSLKYNSALAAFYEEQNTVNVQLPTLATDDEKPSVSEQAAAWGLRLGDVLTFPFIYQTSVNNTWEFGYLRIIFRKETDSDFNVATFPECFDINSSLPVYITGYIQSNFVIQLETAVNAELDVFGTTILSRKSNNRWLRSNASIIFPGSPINNPTAAQALATYPVGTNYILNGANIRGGGIAPDNRLRIVNRMTSLFPIHEETYYEYPDNEVPVCSFNRMPLPGEIAGHLKFILDVAGEAVTLPVSYDPRIESYSIQTNDGGLQLQLRGLTMYATNTGDIFNIWDVDLDGQHRRGNTSIEKEGYLSMAVPAFGIGDGRQLICYYFINSQQSGMYVCSDDNVPKYYDPNTQQITTETWSDDNSQLARLVTEIFKMEFVENPVNGTLDNHDIEGEIQPSFNFYNDMI